MIRFWQKYHRSDAVLFLLHSVRWLMILIYYIVDVHFDHLIKVVSVRHAYVPTPKLLIYLLAYIYLLFIYLYRYRLMDSYYNRMS